MKNIALRVINTAYGIEAQGLAIAKHRALGGQLAKQRLGDIDRHFREAGIGIVQG